MPKIFVSHSSKDKELVDALVDLLVVGSNLPRDAFFCSSLPGTDIPPGSDFLKEILSNINQAQLIILLLSPNYQLSEFCYAELGITWYLRDTRSDSLRIFPLIVPPLSSTNASSVFQVTQSGQIDDDGWLDKMRDNSLWATEIVSENTALWSYKKSQFLEKLPTLLKNLPASHKISESDHENLRSNYSMAQKEIAEKEKEINRLQKLVEDLKALKDSEKASAIDFESLDETAKLEALITRVVNDFREIPNVVQRALYYWNKGEVMRIRSADAADAADRGLLKIDDNETGYIPVESNPKIKRCQKAIDDLQKFLAAPNDEFHDAFQLRYDYRADLHNLNFWKDHLLSYRG